MPKVKTQEDLLRQEVRVLKALSNIDYQVIADKLGIKAKSFYNWLAGQYDFSEQRERQLKGIIAEMVGIEL